MFPLFSVACKRSCSNLSVRVIVTAGDFSPSFFFPWNISILPILPPFVSFGHGGLSVFKYIYRESESREPRTKSRELVGVTAPAAIAPVAAAATSSAKTAFCVDSRAHSVFFSSCCLSPCLSFKTRNERHETDSIIRTLYLNPSQLDEETERTTDPRKKKDEKNPDKIVNVAS